MIVKLKKLNDSAVLPKKVHNDDFCYDVTATSIEEIRPNVFTNENEKTKSFNYRS